MRMALAEIMLRRSFASIIDGRDIGDQLPAVQRINIACEYTPLEREQRSIDYSIPGPWR
jgi:hypothetical protein